MNKKCRWPDPGLCLSWEAYCLGRGCYSIFLNGKVLLMFLFSCYSDTVDCSSLRTDSVISADLAILILHNHLVPLWATNNLLLSCCQGWLNHSHLSAPVSSSLLRYQHHFLAFAGMGNSLQTEKSRRQKQWENPFLCITWGNSISVGLGFFKVYEKYHCSYLCSLIRKWAVWFYFSWQWSLYCQLLLQFGY